MRRNNIGIVAAVILIPSICSFADQAPQHFSANTHVKGFTAVCDYLVGAYYQTDDKGHGSYGQDSLKMATTITWSGGKYVKLVSQEPHTPSLTSEAVVVNKYFSSWRAFITFVDANGAGGTGFYTLDLVTNRIFYSVQAVPETVGATDKERTFAYVGTCQIGSGP